MYKKTRKLKVNVRHFDTDAPMKGMMVGLPQVKTSITMNGATYELPLTAYTDNDGNASFEFNAAGNDNSKRFDIQVVNPPSNTGNFYQSGKMSVAVPLQKGFSYETVYMAVGGCIKGTVYKGNSNASPAKDAIVRVVVVAGATQRFDATPLSGYQIAEVTVDGQSKSAITSFTFSHVHSDHQIHAIFAQVP